MIDFPVIYFGGLCVASLILAIALYAGERRRVNNIKRRRYLRSVLKTTNL
ncbi:MAG TPA: hypothetical protein VHB20_14500 [Verrucomicrobiae bacterium]|jgi:hypothetical protein|nr:hypothetical protein [Verrucomicrobiae bacterium]